MALSDPGTAAPWRLAEALAILRRTARDRRTLAIGSPEHTAALQEEARLCETIYRLAQRVR